MVVVSKICFFVALYQQFILLTFMMMMMWVRLLPNVLSQYLLYTVVFLHHVCRAHCACYI